MTSFRIAVLVGALLVALASPTFAQSEMGRISGIVRDQSGLAVPGATVVVKNEKTGQARETVSGAEGRYTITNLPASVYTVRAVLSGFATTEIVNSLMTAELLDPLDLRTVRARLIWEPSWTC